MWVCHGFTSFCRLFSALLESFPPLVLAYTLRMLPVLMLISSILKKAPFFLCLSCWGGWVLDWSVFRGKMFKGLLWMVDLLANTTELLPCLESKSVAVLSLASGEQVCSPSRILPQRQALKFKLRQTGVTQWQPLILAADAFWAPAIFDPCPQALSNGHWDPGHHICCIRIYFLTKQLGTQVCTQHLQMEMSTVK